MTIELINAKLSRADSHTRGPVLTDAVAFLMLSDDPQLAREVIAGNWTIVRKAGAAPTTASEV